MKLPLIWQSYEWPIIALSKRRARLLVTQSDQGVPTSDLTFNWEAKWVTYGQLIPVLF